MNRSRQVTAYLAALEPASRARLKSLRTLIAEVAPDAEEGFSYRMPSYRAAGGNLAYLAGWDEHVALYGPVTMAPTLQRQAAKYRTGRGTLAFHNTRALPLALIRRLVKARLAELRAKQQQPRRSARAARVR